MFFKVSALFSALQSFGQRFCLCSFEMAQDGGRDVQNVGQSGDPGAGDAEIWKWGK